MGQLTNLYVSESYQGLLKLADSTTGVTSALQYVQDGLGNNTALQISKTQVNITGSLTVNGSPIAGTDTGSLMKTGSVAGNVLTFTKGDGSTFNLSVDTGSVPSGTISGSQQIIDLGFLQTSSFNSYTSSNDSKVNSLIASTGSYATTSSLTSLSQSIATTDLGQDGRLNSLESATGSLQNQINQKLDTGSFNSYTSSNDAKVNSLINATGSYATTGSNNFVGQQNINGSVNVTGSVNITGNISATSASFTYVNTVYETASVIYSSGSNQFGDASNDTQTLWGTVNLPSGPLVVTGSVTSTGGFTGSLQGTASFATNANSASFAPTVIPDWVATTSSLNSATGSLLKTGSVAGNVLTFTKGDGTTFNLTVDTGSAASINTGSFATTGSNIFRGSQVISGSLIGNSLNNGMIFINSEAYESGSVKANISASAAISQSNIFFGGTTGPSAANFTGSIVISGSNSIFMGGPRPSSIVVGTYGYSNGNLNIQTGQQTLNTASVYRPTTSQNFNNSSLSLNFTSGALLQPNLSGNIIDGAVTIAHQSASLNYTNNINVGAVNSNANNILLPFLTTIQQNIFGAATNTINHISSSVTATNNLTAGGSLTVTNLVSSSASPNINGLSFNNNIIGGNTVGVWVSGSNPTNRRTITGNLLGGGATAVTASAVGSEFSSLQNSVVWGQNLIISGTHPANAFGGTAFFGRYNDTTTLHTSQEIVFAVGTGTGVSARRTGFWITSGSLVNVSGSLSVTGGLDVSGGITGAIAIPNFVITTGSIAGTQNITGSLKISGSSPLQVGTSNNVGVIKTLGGSNWLYRSVDDYNTIVGNVQGLNGGFFAGSEKNMVFNGFFSPFATGSNNVIIQGAGDDFISGSGNIFIGSHGSHAGGSNNILLGATSYSSGSIFNDKFELGTQSSPRIFHKQGTNPLQIGDDVEVTGSLLVSNLSTSTGSFVVTTDSTGTLTKAPFNEVAAVLFSQGQFAQTGTLTAASGVSGSVSYDISGSVNGITLVSGSRLTIPTAGVYNIQFSAQWDCASGADTGYAWFKKNGSNISNSNTKVTMPNNTSQVMTVNILETASVGDYYEVAWQNDASHARLLGAAATGNLPAIPSVITTITQVR